MNRPGKAELPVYARNVIDSQGSFVRNAARLTPQQAALMKLSAEIAAQLGEVFDAGSVVACEVGSDGKPGLVAALRPPGMWMAVVGEGQDPASALRGLLA